jgi:metal-dependent HD superfamily phosphatase/phosphodiesterase
MYKNIEKEVVYMDITYNAIKENEEIRNYIQQADANLEAMGYSEHGFAHVGSVAKNAAKILREFGYEEKDIELAKIAGYMHDIGNVVNRTDHAHNGALMAFNILRSLDVNPVDIGKICSAIGNHDERTAYPVNPIAAAIQIADKCDVRRNRVRKVMLKQSSAIHYNVNYSVAESKIDIDPEKRIITLSLTIDTEICSVMTYFEIFLERMKLCKLAAQKLDGEFILIINDQIHG